MSAIITQPAPPKEPEDIKKRKITYSKPAMPPRKIAPFTNGQSEPKKIYPLSNYSFIPKTNKEYQEHQAKESAAETAAIREGKQYKRKTFKIDQVSTNNQYFKALKEYNDIHGTRRFIQFILVSGVEKELTVLLFKEHNQLKIPGGWLKHDESEQEGGERLLKELFDAENETNEGELIVDEVVGRWWRTDLKQNVYPYLPRHVSRPKELIKTVLVSLPPKRKLSFPEFYKNLHPFPLMDLYDSPEPELKALPLLLSKCTFEFFDSAGKSTKEITRE